MIESSYPNYSASFSTFGELLKYLRRKEQLTQLELSIKVGYSEAQISRLEKNQRLPDVTGVKALFIPALNLKDEPEFATRLLELAESARQADAPTPGVAPYKGLLYFDESDTELFFGRELLTAQLTKHVIDQTLAEPDRFLAVIGASGSGKSSLVRAGLAVSLRKAGWGLLIFTPTTHPLHQLEARLHSSNGENEERVLILVDQFEELFTLCRDEIERIGFIEKLLSFARGKSKKYSVVIAMRADFYPRCAPYPQLRQAIATEQEYIGQMTLEELREVIEEPARRNGWELEPGLVEIVLQDLSTHGANELEPGALPLLSHALLATWERRCGRMLTLDGYHASGGVRGAIAETAESVFTDQLNQKQQEVARHVFLRLTELGEGTEDTRRRVALSELVPNNVETDQVEAVLSTLAQARLITLNEDSAEVAHEALIREWHRLHDWLTQDRDGLLLHRHLTDSAHDWEIRGRDAADLYRGARLAQIQEWASDNAGHLNQVEREFINASLDLEQREMLEREAQRLRELENAQRLLELERQRAEEEQKSASHLQRRAIYLGISLAGVFLLLLVAIIFARQANQNYQASLEQSRLATARELSSAALNNLDVDQERSVLLAMQAVKTADIPETENALHQAILSTRLRDTLPAHTGMVFSIAYSPVSTQGGPLLATAGQDYTIKTWKVDETGIKVSSDPLVTIFNPTPDWNGSNVDGITLAFSPDGKQLASFGSNYTIKIWDTANGKLLKVLIGLDPFVVGIAFSPTEELLAASFGNGRVKIWDTQTWQELQTLTVDTQDGGPLAFSPDGKHLATGIWSGGTVIVWDRTDAAITPKNTSLFVPAFSIESQLADGIYSIAFSPDGKKLAIGSKEIKVYDISTATTIFPARLMLNIPAHQMHVVGLLYSPDGRRLISASEDGTAKVWDAETGQALFTLAGNAGPLLSAADTRDGNILFTAYTSGLVKVWDLSIEGNQEWLTIPDIGIGYETRSGSRLVDLNADPAHPRFQVFEISPGGVREVTSIPMKQAVPPMLFDVDQALSRLVVLYPDDYTVHVFDLTTGQEENSFSVYQFYEADGKRVTAVNNIKLSPDGTLLITNDDVGHIYLWDVQTGNNLHRFYSQDGFFDSWGSLDFSLDGTMIAAANSDGSVCIWDVRSQTNLHCLPGHIGPYANAVFSKDGKFLLAAGKGTTVNLLDVQTGKQVLALPQLPTYVDNLEISPNGKVLAVARIDGITQLWDASNGQELLTLPGFYVKFTEDGKHLLAWKDGILYGYILDIDELMALANTRLTRTWTQEECSKYLHTDVCPVTP